MKKAFYIFMLSLVLAGCGRRSEKTPYVYELTTVNTGQTDAAGVDLFFKDLREGVGGLGANRRGGKTHDLFETQMPYPTRIEYTPGKVTTDNRVSITDITVVGQLERGKDNQTLTVEIDTTQNKAICRVGTLTIKP